MSSIIQIDCGTKDFGKIEQKIALQSVSCFKVVRLFNNQLNEDPFSYLNMWVQCYVLLFDILFPWKSFVKYMTRNICWYQFNKPYYQDMKKMLLQ